MSHKPITVLFDANPIAQSGKSGVGYYTYRLIDALAKYHPDEVILIGHYYDFLGRKKQVELPRYPNLTYRTTKLLPGKVFNGLRRKLHIETPLELLARRRADVLLFPNFALSPSLFNKPRVGAIHDLYFLEKPEHIQAKNLDFLRQYVPKTAKEADLVLCVSQFSKDTLVKEFGTSADNVLVTHIPPHTLDAMPKPAARKIVEQLGISKETILAVGTLEPRKNFERLVAAYEQLSPALQKKYSLVITGGGGWNNEALLEAVKKAQKEGIDVHLTGYVSEEQKTALYTSASLVVVPSLYEGFGMQLLEAMQVSVPIVASDIAVFHEVATNAARYVDPLDASDIAKGMSEVLQDATLRKKLVDRGQKRLAQFSWETIANDVYKELKELYRG